MSDTACELSNTSEFMVHTLSDQHNLSPLSTPVQFHWDSILDYFDTNLDQTLETKANVVVIGLEQLHFHFISLLGSRTVVKSHVSSK